MVKKINICVDKGINFRTLKRLMREKGIDFEIYDANIENPTKIEKKQPLAILGPINVNNYPSLGSMRLGGKDHGDNFETFCSIVGKENMGDILPLETAINEDSDYLITKDGDILSKKDEISKKFPNLKIMDQEELERHLEELDGS